MAKILVTKRFPNRIEYTTDYSASGCNLDVRGIPSFIPTEDGVQMRYLDANDALVTTDVPKNTVMLFIEKCRQVLVNIT